MKREIVPRNIEIIKDPQRSAQNWYQGYRKGFYYTDRLQKIHKTLLAQAIAREIEQASIQRAARIYGTVRWMGASASGDYFENAKQSPSVIFIDEVDALAANGSWW